jgi:hypothetical protein
MKNIFFLCSLPRAGNTLFGSLLNQNKKINVTANTILCDLLYNIFILKQNLLFKNFPDHKSLDNVFKNVFNNYYQNWESDTIIDRGTWGTPDNLFLLKKIIEKPKFIILYRPVIEVLSSFVKIYKPKNIEDYCDNIMDKQNGMVGKSLWSIKNIIKTKENYILLNYNNLVEKPEEKIKEIYKYLNISYEGLKTKNLDQFSLNGVVYNDQEINCPDLHKIKTNEISLPRYDIRDILTKEIINKYLNWDIPGIDLNENFHYNH